MDNQKFTGLNNVISNSLHLSTLNHISLSCACVEDSLKFYSDFLGFIEVKRPGSLDFDGSWLYNYGIGIHLLKDDSLKRWSGLKKKVNPKTDHISFQCEDIELVEQILKKNNYQYLRQVVKEGGIFVDQLFFHDPDGHMIEICNCQLLPVVPLTSPTFGICSVSAYSKSLGQKSASMNSSDTETSSAEYNNSQGKEIEEKYESISSADSIGSF